MGDLSLSFPTGEYSLWSSSLYYKRMNHLISFRDQPSYLTFGKLDNVDATEWEKDIITGEGESWGIENRWQFAKNHWYFDANYTYAKSNRRFENKYLGFTYPYQFERPHELALSGHFTPSEKFKFGLTFQWGSGVAQPLVGGTYDLFDRDNFFIETIFVAPDQLELLVMPAYHRLDLSAAYSWSKSELFSHQVKVSLINLYHQHNITFPKIFLDDASGSITFGAGLPFIPSLSYQISFNSRK